MTQKEFFASLQWQEGRPTDDPDDLDAGHFPQRPMVCQDNDGEMYVVGNSNFRGGICDDCHHYYPENVVKFAYLWDEAKK